ncbi:L-threonate dehydrogenase [Lachnellula cervina]|uniref:L-threonate dehydrogenase n=1 Tax=Lachnellula cervina TaxID=1316786 RepID=A0A7D8UNP3_9HELO|nr:L-threonate dehydrogenase [Lachnellula cervina]
MSDPSKVAFLGLGAMGFGMATNLLHHFPNTTGFDVWAPTLSRFTAAGGNAAQTPVAAVKGAKYVVFMVTSAAQILSCLFDESTDTDTSTSTSAATALEKGAIVILCSTTPPDHARAVRQKLDAVGRSDVAVVDAPVSGGTVRAADGTLSIFAAGAEADVRAAKPVLDGMAGSNLWVIEGGLGAGTNVKMVHQVLAGIHVIVACEAMGFAARLGLNTQWAFEELQRGEGNSWMFGNRTPHMLVDDKKIYSAVNNFVKDIGIITTGGRAVGLPLFLSSASEQVFVAGFSAGYGAKDDAELVKIFLPNDLNLVLEQTSLATTSSKDASKLDLVAKLMAAVHLVAAVEATTLGAKVGLQPQQLFDICVGAAGTSFMYKDRIPQLLSGKWTSKKTVDKVIAELKVSVEAAQQLKYPLPLSGTALQLLQLASLRGLGKEPDVAISRIWDGVDGPLFPGSKV